MDKDKSKNTRDHFARVFWYVIFSISALCGFVVIILIVLVVAPEGTDSKSIVWNETSKTMFIDTSECRPGKRSVEQEESRYSVAIVHLESSLNKGPDYCTIAIASVSGTDSDFKNYKTACHFLRSQGSTEIAVQQNNDISKLVPINNESLCTSISPGPGDILREHRALRFINWLVDLIA